MGMGKKLQAAAGTAAVIAGSLNGVPATEQAARHQEIQQRKRQTAALQEASKRKQTTSGR